MSRGSCWNHGSDRVPALCAGAYGDWPGSTSSIDHGSGLIRCCTSVLYGPGFVLYGPRAENLGQRLLDESLDESLDGDGLRSTRCDAYA